MAHTCPADTLLLRHVYTLALGLGHLLNPGQETVSVDVWGTSAGTHTALAFAANLPMLSAEWRWAGGKDLRINDL
eukprot:12252708-Heterocapsa_arctica.AAC.1